LIAYGNRRRKDQRRLAHAPQCFQPDYRLSGPGRCDEMEMVVVEVRIEFRQDTRLVWPPRVAKLNALRKRGG
jgi:hypothetical protein